MAVLLFSPLSYADYYTGQGGRGMQSQRGFQNYPQPETRYSQQPAIQYYPQPEVRYYPQPPVIYYPQPQVQYYEPRRHHHHHRHYDRW
jgi:hypothetical protein